MQDQQFRVDEEGWLRCPICKGRTRTRIRSETILMNFPVYCPRCKREYLIDAKYLKVNLSIEPDAKTQSC